MILVALEEAATKGELLLVEGGMCRFHRLRDGSVTIREIIVLPHKRRQGIGWALVQMVLLRAGAGLVRAKCPADYSANEFWRALGFVLRDTREGINLWERPALA